MSITDTSVGRAPRPALIPRRATLDGFVSEASEAYGLDLRDLEPLTTVTVETRNSIYRIIVSHDTSVLVQGGQFFPDVTPGRLDGASLGGSFLKMGWVLVGFRMEIFADGQRIITSPVRDISIRRSASERPH